MRKATRSFALVVAAGLLLAAVAPASVGSVQVNVVDNGSAVSGATVDVLTSSGVTRLTTDRNGAVVFDAANRSFRLRVNGRTDSRVLSAADSPVVVEI